VRFTDNLTEAQIDNMPYIDIVFRSAYMLKERLRISKNQLVAASFNAWQSMSIHVKQMPTWPKYLKNLGLSDAPDVEFVLFVYLYFSKYVTAYLGQ